MKCAIGQITLPTFCGQNSRSVYNPQNMHKRKTQSLLNQLSVIYTYWWKGQVEEQTRKSNKVYATQRETLWYTKIVTCHKRLCIKGYIEMYTECNIFCSKIRIDVIISQNNQRSSSIADIFLSQAGVIRLNSFPHKMRKQRMLQISWGYHLIL